MPVAVVDHVDMGALPRAWIRIACMQTSSSVSQSTQHRLAHTTKEHSAIAHHNSRSSWGTTSRNLAARSLCPGLSSTKPEQKPHIPSAIIAILRLCKNKSKLCIGHCLLRECLHSVIIPTLIVPEEPQSLSPEPEFRSLSKGESRSTHGSSIRP